MVKVSIAVSIFFILISTPPQRSDGSTSELPINIVHCKPSLFFPSSQDVLAIADLVLVVLDNVTPPASSRCLHGLGIRALGIFILVTVPSPSLL